MWVRTAMTVAVPVSAAYREWTRFESFPRFLDGLIATGQRDSASQHWAHELDRKARPVDTVVTDEDRDRRVDWVSVRGPEQTGVVTFDHLQVSRCRVTLAVCYSRERMLPQIVDQQGLLHGMLNRCVHRFAAVAENSWNSSPQRPTRRAERADRGCGNGKHARKGEQR